MKSEDQSNVPSVAAAATNTLTRFVGSLVFKNVAVVLWVLFGLWFFSVTFLRLLPMPGIADQPAFVNEVGVELASFKHLIFDGKLWFPPPSPPSNV